MYCVWCGGGGVRCVLSVVCLCVRVGEGRAGQGVSGEVDIIQQNTRKMNRMGDMKRLKNIVKAEWANAQKARNIGNIVKTRTPFLARYGHPWTPFLHFSWDLPTFSVEGPVPNAQKGTFLPEVPIQRS